MSWLLFWIVLGSPIVLLGILGAKDWLLRKPEATVLQEATEGGSTIKTRAARRAVR